MALTVKDLLEAGCHFGHQTKRWNPKMKDFVYGSKNGISIIDITKTIYQIADACNFLQRTVVGGGKILFVGTKRQAQQIVREASDVTGMNYMTERWMGGTLTNNTTIRKSIRKMQEIDEIISAENSPLKKKEIAVLSRQSEKLHRDLDGIADMKKLPDVVVVVDVCHDEIAVREAHKLGIPIVAIVDTNGDPENIDYPIAANDDAVKSIKVIMDTFMETIKDAAEIWGRKEAENKAKAQAVAAEKAKEEPKQQRASRGERGDRGDRGDHRGERGNDRGGRRPSSGGARRPSRKPAAEGIQVSEEDVKAKVEGEAENAPRKKAAPKKAAPRKAEDKPAEPKAEAKAEAKPAEAKAEEKPAE
ncbi:MAG: 30S ribosomal protein S2 [Lentisphaerae bacterium ADurb.Bin242]|nr:MAG: 30S ribosomal protein S2 [Lentisphaerae bacterium ADurb.Bin242]